MHGQSPHGMLNVEHLAARLWLEDQVKAPIHKHVRAEQCQGGFTAGAQRCLA